jgi:hypothetical protein
MPQYRALVDLFVMPGSIYVQAGSIISNAPGDVLPANWTPPAGSVDPIDTQAIQNFWTAGPAGMSSADHGTAQLGPWWSGQRWTGIAISPPSVYWVPAPGGFKLTGGGASLGVHPPV